MKCSIPPAQENMSLATTTAAGYGGNIQIAVTIEVADHNRAARGVGVANGCAERTVALVQKNRNRQASNNQVLSAISVEVSGGKADGARHRKEPPEIKRNVFS
jgi:hypothetical protein